MTRPIVVSVLGIAAAAQAQNIVNSQWVGAPGAAWGLATNWVPAAVPSNSGITWFDVTLGPGSTPLLSQNVFLHELDVQQGAQLVLAPNAKLYLPQSVQNNGVITCNSAAGVSYLIPQDVGFTFDGTGLVEGPADHALKVLPTTALYSVSNGPAHTIRGNVQVSWMASNAGTLEATNASTLTVTFAPTSLVANTGIIRAKNGGSIWIANGTFQPGVGRIVAEPGGFLRLDGLVNNALVESEGTGLSAIGNAAVRNCTFTGSWRMGSPKLSERLTNDGTMSSDGASLTLNTPTVIDGTGSMTFSNQSTCWLNGSGRRITHDAPHVIRGAARIENLYLTNHSVIESSTATGILLILLGDVSESNINDGVLRATSGSQFTMIGSLTNTSGQIVAGDGSNFHLDGASIDGGTLRTEGSGTLTATAVQLKDLVMNGPLTLVSPANYLFLSGSVESNSTITLTGPASLPSNVGLVSDCSLLGNGTIRTSNTARYYVKSVGGLHLLRIGPGQTFRGAPQFDELGVVNEGTILCDIAVASLINPKWGGFNNLGSLVVTGSGSLTVQAGSFKTSGLLQVDAGRTLARTESIFQTSGVVHIDGTLAISGGTLAVSGGQVEGCGTATGGMTVTSGIVAPGCPIGTLTSAGAVTLGAQSVLQITLGGTPAIGPNDRLTCNAAVTLGGSIEVSLAGGVVPAPGDEYTVLSGTSVTGSFQSVSLPVGAELLLSATAVRVRFKASGLTNHSGDLNLDGAVDGQDLGLLLAAWGACDHCIADLDGNGLVDGMDLGILLGDWGRD